MRSDRGEAFPDPTSTTQPPPEVKSTRSLLALEVSQALPRANDLGVLPLLRWAPSLVISTEQQDELVSIGVEEHPQQQASAMLSDRRVLRLLVWKTTNELIVRMAETELGESFAEIPAVFGCADIQALPCEDLAECSDHRCPFAGLETLEKTDKRFPPRGFRVEHEGVSLSHLSTRQTTPASDPVRIGESRKEPPRQDDRMCPTVVADDSQSSFSISVGP